MGDIMFDLQKTIQRIKQLRHDNKYGLPDTTKPKQPEQRHISKTIDYDYKAMREGQNIKRAFSNRTELFGKRLKKKSQHRAIGRNY